MNIDDVEVPELDIDKEIARIRGEKVKLSRRQKTERQVIACLIAHMAERGWNIKGVHDYEVFEKATDTKSAMEFVFNLDACNLHFIDKDDNEHCVCIVLGNDGWDAISDWFYADGDPDGFDKAMNEFDTEQFA